MSPEQTAANYDRIAQHWDNPQFDRSNGIKQHERAFQFSSKSGKALDIGCGSSGRIIEWLLGHGFEVEGLDLSREMLNRARRHHPDIIFHEADICTWNFPGQFDLISAWDSIWHVPLEKQKGVIQKICKGLSPGGVFIFSSGGLDHPDEVTNPCFGQPLYHATPGIPALLRLIEDAGCHCRHLEYDGGFPDQHIYLIVQRAFGNTVDTRFSPTDNRTE